jgi:hypothetical protein
VDDKHAENDEGRSTNDERSPNDEWRSQKGVAVNLSLLSAFVIRHSFDIRHSVIRHSQDGPVLSFIIEKGEPSAPCDADGWGSVSRLVGGKALWREEPRRQA